jgi:hypothetical protein
MDHQSSKPLPPTTLPRVGHCGYQGAGRFGNMPIKTAGNSRLLRQEVMQ